MRLVQVVKLIINALPDDPSRVKLNLIPGDPNSDYINANYLNVSLMLTFCVFM